MDTRYEKVVAKLKAHGYRLTPQRLATIRIMTESTEHPSAAQVFKRLKELFPTTSLATVYKTIAVLTELGEVMELRVGGEVRYDVRCPRPHPHLICVGCRRVVDVEVDEELLASQQALARRMAEAAGYQMVSYHFNVYGLCPVCRQKQGDAA